MTTPDTHHLLKTLLDHVQDAVIATDMNGHLLFFNQAAQKLIGFPDKLVKEEWLEYFDLSDPVTKIKIEPRKHPVFRAIKDEIILNEEMLIVPKRRTSKEVLIQANIFHSNEKRAGIILQFRDISALKEIEKKLSRKSKSLMEGYEGLRRAEVNLKTSNNELEKIVSKRTIHLTSINRELHTQILTRIQREEELKKSNVKLVKINEDLDDFVYTASHGLKTPISNIEGLIQAIKDEAPYSEGNSKTYIDLIEQSLEKLKCTIGCLSEISETQKQEEEKAELLNLEQVYSGSCQIFTDLIYATQAEITTDFSRCPEVYFPKKHLKTILENLLSNSLKFKSFKRTLKIHIQTEKTQDHCILTIKDNGLGFDESKKNKIFAMFSRLHDHVEGSGIGLYLVKRIVENAQGKIEVTSLLNEGTTFKVFFPISN